MLTTHTHTRLTALFPGLPRWAGTRKVNQSGFYWSKRQWVAVASAGPYASLHLAPDPITQIFTGRMPFMPPNQSVKALKEKPFILKISPQADMPTFQTKKGIHLQQGLKAKARVPKEKAKSRRVGISASVWIKNHNTVLSKSIVP